MKAQRQPTIIRFMHAALVYAVFCIVLTCMARQSNAEASGDAVAMELSVETPRLRVTEYHRPYVAIWVEDGSRNVAAHLAVWYQLKDGDEGAGTKWLPDLRQWWRRGGRSMNMPVDGLSGATRPVGTHELKFPAHGRMKDVKPGKYTLIVEASREVGGRELVKIPFTWPADKTQTLSESGENELGKVTLKLHPAK